MKKGIIYSFIVSLFICLMMPFSISAAGVTGSRVSFTNNSGYTDNLILYRTELQPISGYSGSTYKYAFYFQCDPGIYGYIQGYINNNSTLLFTVGVENGISETFYASSDYSNVTVNYVDLYESMQGNILFQFPIESYKAVNFCFSKDYELLKVSNYGIYNFPSFQLSSNDQFITNYSGTYSNEFWFICGINRNIYSTSTFENVFNLINCSYDTSSLKILYRWDNPTQFTLFKVKIVRSNSDSGLLQITSKSSCEYMPIYFGPANNNNISLDFALEFDMSNRLLDALESINIGTEQSQSAVENLEQGTSDLASDISSYNQIESDYNNQMNQALNNIDFSDQFSNNQNFLSGASFVKTVFNSFMQIDILRIFFIVLCIVLIAKRFI